MTQHSLPDPDRGLGWESHLLTQCASSVLSPGVWWALGVGNPSEEPPYSHHLGTQASGCTSEGLSWAWTPITMVPLDAVSASGVPLGLTLTRQGFYYPASQVGRSDAGPRDVFHRVSEQMLLGPQAPGKGLEGWTPVALSCCCIRSPCQPCQGGASTPPPHRPGGKAPPPRGLCSSLETPCFQGAF